MKWFLITLALGLATSDKLDRTYLPPPGAQFSGGILGSHDAPLEPPHHTHSGPKPDVTGHDRSQPTLEVNGEPVNFGDKIPKVPVTTTSYAFSQTTTYPSGEGFETTLLPINPVTGLPGNFPQDLQNIHNLPSLIQSQAPTYGTDLQPSLDQQGATSAPVNYGNLGFNQFANNLLHPHPGQNVISPGGGAQIPGSIHSQNPSQSQYPGGQIISGQQGFPLTDAPDNQRNDFPGQNVIGPGGVIQIPGKQVVTGQQRVIPSIGSPIHLQPDGNQHRVNYDGSHSPISQEIYNGQPIINIPNLDGTQPTQTSFPNQDPNHVGGVTPQYPNRNQNYRSSVPTGSENLYQPSSTPFTSPSSFNNGASTALAGISPLTSTYASVGPVYRPERPQAASDRNAVILNYENIRTPNGYSYSFDTSNGIHAHESGIVDNGTKAQGAYSYIGDDGKVYSVSYTADENGFQPRGDHLPTPPPIPEAIQRVIEQAARDKAAGIIHDGSYDEEKYGDKNYQAPVYRRRPQNQDANQFVNDQSNKQRSQDDLIRPITGIKDVVYNEGKTQDQINNNYPVTGTEKVLNGKLPERQPTYEINREKYIQDIPIGTDMDLKDGDSLKDFYKNGLPIVKQGIYQVNNFGSKKQEPSVRRPTLNGVDLPIIGTDDTNQNDLLKTKYHELSTHRPTDGVKDITDKYPGSNVDVGGADYSDTERDGLKNSDGQDIGSRNTIMSYGSGENISLDFVTGDAIAENKKINLRQRIKEKPQTESTGDRHSQYKNNRPQSETAAQENIESPNFSDYSKNAIAQQKTTQQDGTGYHYQQPNNIFEQNAFPTRFSPQDGSSTENSDQNRAEHREGTTRKPFMTPNIYNKSNRDSQSSPNVFDQNNRNSQSTTRRPFTTNGVTSSMDNSYTDYDGGDDYVTDQDIGDDRVDSTGAPAVNGITSRPYQATQTTLRPQNIPGGQRTRVSQKGTVTPGHKTENSETKLPGYTYGPTTQMPSHNSRFGSTEIPRRMKLQQRRPTTTDSDSITATSSPVTTQFPFETRQSGNKYQTTGPVSKYFDSNVGSGFPTSASNPSFGLMSTTPGGLIPQDYYTTTYGPSQGYPTTTAAPPSAKYTHGTSSKIPFGTDGSSQPSQDEIFHAGYHYGPPKAGPFNLDGGSSGNSGIFPTSPIGPYQTTYQQGPSGFPSTTIVPLPPGTFSPNKYQGNYQNGPSTPDYATTIASSTPGGKPIYRYPGSHEPQQDTTGYEYGPTRPTFPTTGSPTTIGTTLSSFIPSETSGPTQDYSTTYRPGFQTTKDTYVGGPVDGFGRPITTQHDGLHPGFIHPTQGATEPVNDFGQNFGGTDQISKYPGSYDQPRVIGEDFSGPKQPQRYDPKTGYHYK